MLLLHVDWYFSNYCSCNLSLNRFFLVGTNFSLVAHACYYAAPLSESNESIFWCNIMKIYRKMDPLFYHLCFHHIFHIFKHQFSDPTVSIFLRGLMPMVTLAKSSVLSFSFSGFFNLNIWYDVWKVMAILLNLLHITFPYHTVEHDLGFCGYTKLTLGMFREIYTLP